jgi:hypothetical protein
MTSLLEMSPWSAGVGQRRFGDDVELWQFAQVDSVLSADGGVLHAGRKKYHVQQGLKT